MSKRKETGDLLGDIYAAVSQPKKPSKQQDSKPSKKVKNTYYFDEDVDYRLNKMQLELRRITGEKLSKSEVIEAALRLAIDDFEANEEGSDIATLLLK